VTTTSHSARAGVITDQAGALSFMGIASVNVAKMVIDDRGGLLGRPVVVRRGQRDRRQRPLGPLTPATVSHLAASDTDPSDGPTPLIGVSTPALRVHDRRVAGVPTS
jgi:hypothetical protein